MRVTRKDLDPAQVARMKGVYGMTDEQLVQAAQRIQANPDVKPSKRGRRFVRK